MNAKLVPNLEAIKPEPKSGDEPFLAPKGELGFLAKEFWSWAFSDLVHNVTRGCLAEFIVARALKATNNVRDPWAAYDLDVPRKSGDLFKVEVKSAAYLQSWGQDRFSTIQFDIKPTKSLNPETSRYEGNPYRHAELYVFALLKEKDKKQINPLDTNQWDFYVLPTSRLNGRSRSQDSITLNSFEEELNIKPVSYCNLQAEVQKFADSL